MQPTTIIVHRILILLKYFTYVNFYWCWNISSRSSYPEVFLEKGGLKICRKFTGEHPCRSAISIKLLCNFIEIVLQHGRSPANFLHIFRIPFPKNTSEGLLLKFISFPNLEFVITSLKFFKFSWENQVVLYFVLYCKDPLNFFAFVGFSRESAIFAYCLKGV